ncbi:Aminotransferase class I and II [Nakaseomyces glabratus]
MLRSTTSKSLSKMPHAIPPQCRRSHSSSIFQTKKRLAHLESDRPYLTHLPRSMNSSPNLRFHSSASSSSLRSSFLNTEIHHHSHNNLPFLPAEQATLKDVNECVLNAKYAVRGAIPMRAEELKTQLMENPHSLPFNDIINANIGNPQQLKQKPLSFYRQVLSLLQYPELIPTLENNPQTMIKQDAIDRAKRLLDDIGGSVGAYSSSQGVLGIRKTVADFITNRDDGIIAYPEDIFLTAGASSAVDYLLSIFCRGEETGVLIPIPQYPLYTATLALQNSHALPYYLNEETGWSTDPEELESIILDSIENNIKPSVLVVINPGNPTGAVLSEEAIEQIFTLAAKYGIIVIADEVYQENVFEDVKFHSMKKVLRQLQMKQPGLYDNVQLASLHSTSKGVSGECGQRGGYMELVGFTHDIRQVVLKLASISLCPVVTGQALVDLMVRPPQKGEESYEQDQEERRNIHKELHKRATLLHDAFVKLDGISCQKPQGAMYLFPKLELPYKAIQEALHQDMSPDEFYCKSLLEKTGICTVPGSGFGQEPGTYHLRTTFLAPGTKWIEDWVDFHQEFYNKFKN